LRKDSSPSVLSVDSQAHVHFIAARPFETSAAKVNEDDTQTLAPPPLLTRTWMPAAFLHHELEKRTWEEENLWRKRTLLFSL